MPQRESWRIGSLQLVSPKERQQILRAIETINNLY